jgi:hypothetical protein
MWNAGQKPARMIEVISPAGFEHFFWELADVIAEGPPDPDMLARISERYGLIMSIDAPWLPDLIERYGLPRPAFLPA